MVEHQNSEMLAPVKAVKGMTEIIKQRLKAADDLFSTAVAKVRQPVFLLSLVHLFFFVSTIHVSVLLSGRCSIFIQPGSDFMGLLRFALICRDNQRAQSLCIIRTYLLSNFQKINY